MKSLETVLFKVTLTSAFSNVISLTKGIHLSVIHSLQNSSIKAKTVNDF